MSEREDAMSVIHMEVCDRCNSEVDARGVFLDDYGVICEECFSDAEMAAETERNGGLS